MRAASWWCSIVVTYPAFPRENTMHITLTGTEQDVDLISEVLCVIGEVVRVTTIPAEVPGHVQRKVLVDFIPEALRDQGILLHR